jgi:iron complex outermembrane recepter protein
MSPLASRGTLSALLLALSFSTASEANEIVEFGELVVHPAPRHGSPLVALPQLPHSPLAELARYGAALTISDGGSRGFGQVWSMRGLSNTPFFSDPSVTVYLDGLPLGSVFSFPAAALPWTSITLDRGPSAALRYGRSGDAGVLHFRSAEPGSEVVGSTRTSFASHRELQAVASASGPLGERSGVTATAGHRSRRGFLFNQQLGQSVDDQEDQFVRLKWSSQLSPTLQLSAQALGHRYDDGAPALVPLGGPMRVVERGAEGRTRGSFLGFSTILASQTAAGELRSMTSAYEARLNPLANRLALGVEFASVATQTERQASQELLLAGEDWRIGGFAARSQTRGTAVRSLFIGPMGPLPFEDSRFRQSTDSLAVFGARAWPVGEAWALEAGVRLETTGKDFVRIESFPGTERLDLADRWSTLLPSLTLQRSLDESSEWSLTLSRGHKPGGYSSFTELAEHAVFESQRLWSIESAWVKRENRWEVSWSAYQYWISGYQIERSFEIGLASDEYFVANAERARSVGSELKLAWRPAEAWTLGAVGNVTWASLRDFTEPGSGQRLRGYQAPFAARSAFSFHAAYDPDQGLFAESWLTRTGRVFYDERETTELSQGSYWLVDLRIGYSFPDFQVALFGRNLGDRAYYQNITPGPRHGTPGAPRSVGLELSTDW